MRNSSVCCENVVALDVDLLIHIFCVLIHKAVLPLVHDLALKNFANVHIENDVYR